VAFRCRLVWGTVSVGIGTEGRLFVTHLYDLARSLHDRHSETAVFLCAERRPDGHRTFRVLPAEPLSTSYGEDLYQQIFAADANQAVR
jgi:hypothetical protein